MNHPGRVVVVGAGPTGLGAAHRLQELGHGNYVVLEARHRPGGLAASYLDERGFTWDVGGHVQHSHYDYYERVVRETLEETVEHRRSSYVWHRGLLVPFPLQLNLHRLGETERASVLEGFERAARNPDPRPAHLGAWLQARFGRELCDLFLTGYNEKVWGYPLESLDAAWVEDRVPVPDVEAVRRNLAAGRGNDRWGANRDFFYPLRGGTGAIWSGIAARLPSSRLRLGARVTAVDLEASVVHVNSEAEPYDVLISSMPLDALCSISRGLPRDAASAAGRLIHSAIHSVGVGLSGRLPDVLDGVGWIYFADADLPFHRVTVLSNYSPLNVPPGNHWSLLVEVCETAHRPVPSGLTRRVVEGLQRTGLVAEGSAVVSLWHRREEYGYPTPFRGRDRVLAAIGPALEARGVYSRGRFGAWRYEVSNQDHSFMQGVELVDRLCGLGEEGTLRAPGAVNRRDGRS